MADQSVQGAVPKASFPDDLVAEVARRDEEILRLRDLLMARDAELGELRGRLAMIEQTSRRLGDAVARIPIPGATRVLQALIRFIQRATG